ncbi:MAG: hypothetical protein JXR11_10105 [Balneola sp.]
MIKKKFSITIAILLISTIAYGQKINFTEGGGVDCPTNRDNVTDCKGETYLSYQAMKSLMETQTSTLEDSFTSFFNEMIEENRVHRKRVNSEIAKMWSHIDNVQVDIHNAIQKIEANISENSLYPEIQRDLTELKKTIARLKTIETMLGGGKDDG